MFETIAGLPRRVKDAAGRLRKQSVDYVCAHPLIGWYFAVLLFVNYLLDILAAFF